MAKNSRRKERPGVILYFDRLRPVLENLSFESVGMLLHAIVDYVQYGAEPQLDSMTQFAFNMLRPSLDLDGERYEYTRLHGKYMRYCKKQKDKGEAAIEEDEYIKQLLATESNCQLQSADDRDLQTPPPPPTQKSELEPKRELYTKGELEGCKGEREGSFVFPSYTPLTESEEQDRRAALMRKIEQYPD